MSTFALINKVLTGCFLVSILISTQAYSSIMEVNINGSINLDPIGGDTETSFNGSFEYDSINNDILNVFKILIGDDLIILNDVNDIFKHNPNFKSVNDIFTISSRKEMVDGSILGTEIDSMQIVLGFNTNEIMNELIQTGQISPTVLKSSKFIFTYKKQPGITGLKPLFASIDTINITTVPLSSSYILMLSGLCIFLVLILIQHRQAIKGRNIQLSTTS